MAEEPHAKNGTDAAAEDSGQKQRFLRDPPGILPGFFLVCPHQKKGSEIDEQQVHKQNRHRLALLRQLQNPPGRGYPVVRDGAAPFKEV